MELENKHVKETVTNMFYMLKRIEKNMTVMKKLKYKKAPDGTSRD